jgi:hypothetical protein
MTSSFLVMTSISNVMTRNSNLMTSNLNVMTSTGHKTADQAWSWTGHDQLVISFTRPIGHAYSLYTLIPAYFNAINYLFWSTKAKYQRSQIQPSQNHVSKAYNICSTK